MDVDEILKLFTFKGTGRVSDLYKVWMVAWRRAKIRFNYKTWMLFDFVNTMFMVFTYFLLSFIILPGSIAKAGYSDYFTFAVTGIALSHYVSASLRGLSMTIRLEQFYGTLETILSTPTSFIVLFLGDLLYFFMYSTIFLVMILILGVILGAHLVFNIATLITLTILIVLLVLANLPIGILSAAMILRFKQGNPIGWALTWINQLFAGTFFPISLLPEYLRVFSYALPLTFSLHAIRISLIWGLSILDPTIALMVAILVAYTIIGLPISIKVFRYVYDNVRKTGKLGVY